MEGKTIAQVRELKSSDETRCCKKCNQEKGYSSFTGKLSKINGLYYFERVCNTCKYKVWKVKNKDKVAEYTQKQRLTDKQVKKFIYEAKCKRI